jgi:uncharacterized protein (TIGR02268 family)
MSAPLAAPLLLALLTATSAPALPSSEESDTPGTRLLKLTAENAREQHPVRISRRHSTNLVFDAPLQPDGVTVEDERWVKKAVNEDEGMVMLRLSDVPPPDGPVTVTVRFADGRVPERVTFQLVHAPRAEHEVRVSRQPSTCEPSHLEARQQRERAERCEVALAQKCTCPEGPRPEGLSELIEAEVLKEGKGVLGRKLDRGTDFTQPPGEVLVVRKASSYRAEQPGLMAVALTVDNTGTQPWTAEGVAGAELVSTEGERLRVVRVWQPQPLGPGGQRQLVVEAETPGTQTRGSFLLKLGGAGGAPPLTVHGVTFP